MPGYYFRYYYARYYVWRGVTVGVTVGVAVGVAVGVNAHPDSAAARTSPLDCNRNTTYTRPFNNAPSKILSAASLAPAMFRADGPSSSSASAPAT